MLLSLLLRSMFVFIDSPLLLEHLSIPLATSTLSLLLTSPLTLTSFFIGPPILHIGTMNKSLELGTAVSKDVLSASTHEVEVFMFKGYTIELLGMENRKGVEAFDVSCLNSFSYSVLEVGGKLLSTSTSEFETGQEVLEGVKGGNEKGRGEEVVVDDMDGTSAKLKG